MSELPELYHKNKNGKLYSWKIWVDGCEIHTLHGTVEGEKTPSSKACKGKNLGKANETTPERQALREAQSMWQKKRDKKYRESLEEAQTEFILLPMLAKDFEKRKKKVVYPCDVQPKLDGVRCLAYWKDGRVVLLSRGAKEYNLPHIAAELAPILAGSSIVLDGEAYAHGVGFQTSMSWIKRLQGETSKIRYHVYDIVDLLSPSESWLERKARLNLFFKSNRLDLKSVEMVETRRAPTEEVVYSLQSTFMRQGYEGAIVRHHNGKYVIGGRSGDLLKVKTFMDSEYKIVGYTNGVGKFATCVIWKCAVTTVSGNEDTFNVVPMGNQEHREQLLVDADSHVGKILKVKYFELSDDGIPRFPVGLGARLAEDI